MNPKALEFPPLGAETDAVSTPPQQPMGDEYLLTGRRLLVVFCAMLLSIFLIMLE